MAASDLAAAIAATSARIGANPLDLATAISYETAGTFDPWKAGPTTQWGQHRGLIQWGEPQRQKYGVYEGMPVTEQVDAAGRYLQDAGFKPGMGIADLYSAINAGRVGRYGASDAGNGGAPGTVLDKVQTQMGDHRAKAEQLLAGSLGGAPVPSSAAPADGIVGAGGSSIPVPLAFMSVGPDPGAVAMEAMRGTLSAHQQEIAGRDQQEQQRRAALFGAPRARARTAIGGLYG